MKSLESAEAQVRADGAAHLRELGSEAQVAVPSLIKLLGDQTPTRESGDRSAMAPHGRLFPSPGFEAAQTLALMGGAALEPLAEAAKSPDAATRERAIWALRNWRDPRGAALARAMKDQDAEIRALAAGGMGPALRTIVRPSLSAYRQTAAPPVGGAERAAPSVCISSVTTALNSALGFTL